MNDLNLVGCHKILDYREMNTPKAADVVADMVDALLVGTSDRIARLRGTLDRVAFYDELRYRFARETEKRGRFFNDMMFSPRRAVQDGPPTGPAEDRYVAFFPALPLLKNIELGDWVIGTPPNSVAWASDRFRELSTTLVRSYEKLGFTGGAMLWHRARGFDGSKPTDGDIAAIRTAVTFAVLDANDWLRLTEPDDGSKGPDMATMENADLFIQPIDEGGGITHRRGGALKSTFLGGMRIGDEPPPLADAVQSITRPVPISATLARALFDAVRTKSYEKPSPIAVAAEWHRSALANPPAVTMEQRLIAFKTGFEALFKTSSSGECARKLRALFKNTTARHRDLLPWRGLLWTPNERSDLWRWYWLPNGMRQIERRDEIEDWFKTLADARNDVIHRGSLTGAVYAPPPERPQSRYVGHLLWVGERVLREAIKARLGAEILLCGAIAQRAWAKAQFGQQARELMKLARANPPPPASPEPPPRSLSELLSALSCPAAGLVTLGRLGHPVTITDSTIGSYTYWWGADYGEHSSMIIRNAERDLLKQAGAEDEMPNHLFPCD